MKVLACRSVVFVAGWLVFWPLAVFAQDAMPLRIVEKLRRPHKVDAMKSEMVLTIRNESEQPITAWQFDCVVAENSGNYSTSRLVQDAFLRYESEQASEVSSLAANSQSGLVYPGGDLELVIPSDDEKSGPYDAKSCQVAAVILADATAVGDRQAIKRLFDNRKRIAVDARKTIHLLSRASEALRRSTNAAIEPSAKLTAEIEKDSNWYIEVLAEAELMVAEKGRGAVQRLDELISYVSKELSWVQRHLPKS